MSVAHVCAWGPRSSEKCQVPRTGAAASVGVLGTEPGSLGRAASALSALTLFLSSPRQIFKEYF